MWQTLYKAFDRTRVLQVTDYAALIALCIEWQVYRVAADDVMARGVLVDSAREDEALVKNPAVVIMHAALERWHRLAASFGLTPSDRAKLDIAKIDGEEDNPLAAIIEATTRSRAEYASRQLK